jgi:DNA-binding IclR family transcriptional regulator
VQRAILAFKNGKSDHNESSLCRLFGFDASEARRTVEVLSEIGFLELDSNIYRVPDLYRAGLNIAHGKAF